MFLITTLSCIILPGVFPLTLFVPHQSPALTPLWQPCHWCPDSYLPQPLLLLQNELQATELQGCAFLSQALDSSTVIAIYSVKTQLISPVLCPNHHSHINLITPDCFWYIQHPTSGCFTLPSFCLFCALILEHASIFSHEPSRPHLHHLSRIHLWTVRMADELP